MLIKGKFLMMYQKVPILHPMELIVVKHLTFSAARLRLAATEKAEAEKILQIKRAEGEAESKYLAGLGIARQRQAIVDGLRDSVLGFSENVPGTTAKDVMDMVLVTQYFDTMKEIGAASKSSAVFIPHGPGAIRDVATQIREGLLQASAVNWLLSTETKLRWSQMLQVLSVSLFAWKSSSCNFVIWCRYVRANTPGFDVYMFSDCSYRAWMKETMLVVYNVSSCRTYITMMIMVYSSW